MILSVICHPWYKQVIKWSLVTIYTYLFDAKYKFQFAYKWLSFACICHTYLAYIITKKMVVLQRKKRRNRATLIESTSCRITIPMSPILSPLPRKKEDRKDLTKEKKGKERERNEKCRGECWGWSFFFQVKKHSSLYREPSSIWYLIIVHFRVCYDHWIKEVKTHFLQP